MPRKSRKRGKETKKRGTSKAQICVTAALDRQGNLIIEHLCKDKSYIKLTTDKRIKTGKHKEGIYHTQHINSLHSNLKKWMGRFNGVASKYIKLNNQKRGGLTRVRKLLLEALY